MSLLGITRAIDELAELSAKAEKGDFELVALPLVKHSDVELAVADIELLNNSDWLFFTSARGVNSFLRGMDRAGRPISPQVKIAVVGEMTRVAAESAGLNVSFVPEHASAEVLFTEFLMKYECQAMRATFIGAQDTHFDPGKLISRAGGEYHRIVSYRSEMQTVSESVLARFDSSDFILFTSPLTVRAFAKQFMEPKSSRMAIGGSTSAEMTKLGWKEFVTLPEPKIELALRFAIAERNRTLTHAN